jgi:hypothetical protein
MTDKGTIGFLRRRWRASAAALVMLAIVGGVAATRGGEGDKAAESAFAQITPAEARAAGRQWRASRDRALGVRYAQNLLAAGLNDELIAAIREEKLLGEDPATAALFEAEALVRLRRFADARAIASGAALQDNPFAAFIRLRTASSDQASNGALEQDLMAALRGPDAVAGEAWLFRAQLALADNDFDAAEAAGRRAREAGVSAGRIELLSIETAIRRGDADGAAALLGARAKRLDKVAPVGFVDYEGLRLAALIALRLGATEDAVRFVDRGRLGAAGAAGAPLAALAKWAGGDRAQAYSILRLHLAVAPADWIALDLAAALAADLGRDDAAGEHLEMLARVRPGLGALRLAEKATRTDDLDAAFDRLSSAPLEAPRDGAVAGLLGPGASAKIAAATRFADPGETARRLASLAALGSASGPRALRLAAENALERRRDALTLAAAARAFALAGDGPRAIALAEAASKDAPAFAAPVLLAARLKAETGRTAQALSSLSAFLARNPKVDAARIAFAEVAASAGDFSAVFEMLKAASPALVFGRDETALLFARAAQAIDDDAKAYVTRAAGMTLAPSIRLGRVYEATGAAQLAAAAYRRALVAEPMSPDLPALYLGAMTALGRAEEAKALLAEIERRYPGAAAVAAALRG